MDMLKSRSFTTVIFSAFCFKNIFRPYNCQGPSMEPTLNNKREDDIVLVEKLSTMLGILRVGDIVVVIDHDEPYSRVCKRIKAMEGDTVYNSKTQKYVKVRPGHVYVVGDNEEISYDSNSYGDIPMGLVVGRVYFRCWPLNEITFF
ncbi:Mitochondrial inner membrane protease subunit 1 [Thelohanellus kitauei]|uniref:Mitochondrial inner membrane protease subunit 1 n=1 Tax=Thelohanellus kitauei TaxID=669202 RepID=A0A0C2JYP6_THEKT|nr:Mitochondrial inner membrane protease subunit 1 [Thelohanellus kitauei]